MGKYKKVDVSYKGRSYDWPVWLIPIVAGFLIILVGLFIFVTFDSNRRLGCIFGCDDREETAAEDLEGPTSREPKATIAAQEKLSDTSENKTMITITGNILFPADKIPETLPANSHLNVKFEDVSMADASSVTLGSTEVDLTGYKKGSQLRYTITSPKPSKHGMHSVSAVLNVGWAPSKDEWIRKNDYLSDTSHPVTIEDGKNDYIKDIEVVKYN